MKEFLTSSLLILIAVNLGFIVGYLLDIIIQFIKKKIKKVKRERDIRKILNLKTRYKIYIETRERILNYEGDDSLYICPTLRNVVHDMGLTHIDFYGHRIDFYFPEIALVKPKEIHYWGIAWWDVKDRQSRIGALDRMIWEVLNKIEALY